MTDRKIKQETWSVKELVSSIVNKKITKPKFQRRKKWNTVPGKNDSVPNERDYINFLFDKKNSVHSITFGQDLSRSGAPYSNIDGNNRINAIQHFMNKPFEIFDYLLNDLFRVLNKNEGANVDKFKNTFKSADYNEIIKYNRLDRYLHSVKVYDDCFLELQCMQNEIDDEIELIQKKLKINGVDCFDSTVKISVNLFEGYTTDELSQTFEEINKYNSRLTETELLACRLYNVVDFHIEDGDFKVRLKNSIKEYYETKSDGETLQCYKYEIDGEINAHDFIVGFQNLLHDDYNFIEITATDGLSLLFKLYKTMYGSFDNTFTTKNVNDFILIIKQSCKIIQDTTEKIFTTKLNDKLFNKSCQKKLESLKKNNLYLIISACVGYKRKHISDGEIIKSLEKCLLYHFMTVDIKDKEDRERFRSYNMILHDAGGAYIDAVSKKVLSSPSEISSKITQTIFKSLLETLCREANAPHERKLPNGSNMSDKRRQLKFFAKTLMFYFYKDKVTVNMLDNKFSIEHVVPNSSDWDGEMDKDRTGNLVPIISDINSARGNRSICKYAVSGIGKEFLDKINIIPCVEEYNAIVNHDKDTPIVISVEKYNKMCEENEGKYIVCFINSLFG